MDAIHAMSRISEYYIQQLITDEDYRLRMAAFVTQMGHNELIYLAIIMAHEGRRQQ